MAGVAAIVPEAHWMLLLAATTAAGFLVYGVLLVLVGLRPGERKALGAVASRVLRRDAAPA
jgi:hypothetical protein